MHLILGDINKFFNEIISEIQDDKVNVLKTARSLLPDNFKKSYQLMREIENINETVEKINFLKSYLIGLLIEHNQIVKEDNENIYPVDNSYYIIENNQIFFIGQDKPVNRWYFHERFKMTNSLINMFAKKGFKLIPGNLPKESERDRSDTWYTEKPEVTENPEEKDYWDIPVILEPHGNIFVKKNRCWTIQQAMTYVEDLASATSKGEITISQIDEKNIIEYNPELKTEEK